LLKRAAEIQAVLDRFVVAAAHDAARRAIETRGGGLSLEDQKRIAAAL